MMKMDRLFPLWALFGMMVGFQTTCAVPVPNLSIASTNSGVVSLTISNVAPGSTYYIEQREDLTTNNWQAIASFEGTVGNTNWSAQATGATGFYRVMAEPYLPQVGETATFTTHFHNVMGTAHIVNNHTIELRNFFYDGPAPLVKVIVSPNPPDASGHFSPYTAISEEDNLSSYSNATLTLALPEGLNLSYVSYISVYCVDYDIDFGSGMFQ